MNLMKLNCSDKSSRCQKGRYSELGIRLENVPLVPAFYVEFSGCHPYWEMFSRQLLLLSFMSHENVYHSWQQDDTTLCTSQAASLVSHHSHTRAHICFVRPLLDTDTEAFTCLARKLFFWRVNIFIFIFIPAVGWILSPKISVYILNLGFPECGFIWNKGLCKHK